MKYKAYILLFLPCLSFVTVSAQTNRQKVVALILEEHQLKSRHSGMSQSEVRTSQPLSLLCTSINPLPKYTLPKGNVFCRFEDYVQMHTPMKLNIGVGGQ